MGARIEQAKWAVTLRSRERPPGCLPIEDDTRVRWSEIDVQLAIRGFSLDIRDGDERARERAADALGWLHDPRSAGPLLGALADSAVHVRRAAAHGLALFTSLADRAAEPLVHALADEDQTVRAHAAAALSACRSQLAAVGVTVALADPARAVRASAARALHELGRRGVHSQEALATLPTLLDDEDARVSYEAFWALRAQGGSKTDAQCAAWRWSDAGQRAWRQIARV